MKLEENKKAIRAGYDIDILPSDLVTYGTEAKNLLSELQNHDEKMFLVKSILFMNMSKSKGKLDNTVFTLKSIANRHQLQFEKPKLQTRTGLVASLPLGINEVEIERGLTTSAAAIFYTIYNEELFIKEKVYTMVLNALSRNIIMADRKKLKIQMG